TGNDVWFADDDSVWALSGVQEYGDVRAIDVAMSVSNWLSQSPVREIEYYPELGVIVVLTQDKVLVVNTKAPVPDQMGTLLVYPWSQWEFYKHDLADAASWEWHQSSAGSTIYYLTGPSGADPGITQPEAVRADNLLLSQVTTMSELTRWTWFFGDADALGFNTIYLDAGDVPTDVYMNINTVLHPSALTADTSSLIFSSGMEVYRMDRDAHLDNGVVDLLATARTSLAPIPSRTGLIRKVRHDLASRKGAKIILDVYRNSSWLTPADSVALYIPLRDDVTVDEMGDVPVDDANAILSAEGQGAYRVLTNVHAFSVSAQLRLVSAMSPGVMLQSIIIGYRPLRW
ncbi:MAG: hypothetical protein Q9M13_03370, partial [Mariprofundales bacterium]|nr:hypothetical protein [Mariprofundales bacterium]